MRDRASSLLACLLLMGLSVSCTPVAEVGGWTAAERLDEQEQVYEPEVAMNESGSAVVVWYDIDTPNVSFLPAPSDAQDNVWARHYAPGEGWGPAWRLDLDGSTAADWAYDPQVGLDANGRAVAVWTQGFGGGVRRSIWANSFTSETGWGIAMRLDNEASGNALRPKVAMNPAGRAVAVWQQFEGNRADVWGSHYTVEDGWRAAERVEIDATDTARDPQVAIDDEGRAIAVWNQFDGETFSIWANRSTPGGEWGTATRISSDEGSARLPHVAVDPSGDAMVLWRQSDGGRLGVWSNRFEANRWETAERVDSDPGGDADHPEVAVDASGNAIAVWQQFDGTRFDIWSNRYDVGVGWHRAERIEANHASEAVTPTIAVSAAGNGVALWFEFDGISFEPWSNAYAPVGGWSTAVRVDPTIEEAREGPWADVAIDTRGVAIAVWSLLEAPFAALPEGHVWSARYE